MRTEYRPEEKQRHGWSCSTCIHNSVCKHKEMIEEEARKLRETVQVPPIKITISCDRYKEESPTARPGGPLPYFGSN